VVLHFNFCISKNMVPFYRLILKRALSISWKNKWLWVLAFFAAFIGNGGVYEALLRGFNNISEGRSVFYALSEYTQSGILGMFSWSNISALWYSDPAALGMNVFAMLLILCLLAVLISLGVIGQGGVIRGVISRDEKKKTNFKENFHAGLERFWQILELNVITKVVLLGILMFLAYLASLITFQSAVLNIFVYVLAFIIFIILGIIIYFLTIYGTAFVVLRKKGPFSGLKAAWHLFSKNVLLNLEMGFLLFIINIIVAILFLVATFILLSPFMLLYFIFLMSAANIAAAIIMVIMSIIFIIFMVLIGSWWSTFQLGAWAILFEELALLGGKSKVQRLYEHVAKKTKTKK